MKRCWRKWTRLALMGSPRYLTYSVGARLCATAPSFVRSGAQPPELSRLSALLPIDSPDDTPDWSNLSAAVTRVYREVLVSSLA